MPHARTNWPHVVIWGVAMLVALVCALVDSGRVQQDRSLDWVRVVLSHENGRATQALRVPLLPIAEIPIRSAKRRDHPAY